MGSRSGRGRIASEREKIRLTCLRRPPSRSSAILLVVEGTLGRVLRVFRLLQPLLELSVEQLALLPLGLHALLEALLDLGGARAELVEGRAEVVDRALRWGRLVADHGRELRIERELGLAAGTLDAERLRHGAQPSSRPGE